MDIDIRLIQNKICHSVEEIRVRSLNSLLYKLEQHLIEPAVLSSNKQLHVALLNSLNYTGTGHQQALAILDKITSSVDGAKLLLEVGGIKTLNFVKQTDEDLTELADRITDKMLSVPEGVYAEKQESETETEVGSEISPPNYSSSAASPLQTTTTASSSKVNHLDKTHTIIFPPVYLDDHDHKVLSGVIERLADEKLCLKSCRFICGVLLQDYPVEYFLQNPEIILKVLKLLQESPTQLTSKEIDDAVIDTITRFIEVLDKRVVLFTRNWIDVPKWNKADDLKEKSESIPSLSLPRLVLLTIKYIMPVFGRVENEETSGKLLSYLRATLAFLETINKAPTSFHISTNHLTNMLSVVGDTLRVLYRRWGKTNIISNLSPVMLVGVVGFSIQLAYHFIPYQSISEFLPLYLVDVYRELYTNPVFYLSYKETHKLIERVIADISSDLSDEFVRVSMMLNCIRTSVISSSDITPHSLQHVFDGLEVLVHVPNNSLLELVLRFLVENIAIDVETVSNSIVWCLSCKIISSKVYSFFASVTNSKYISLPKDVLWEICVHGLNGTTEIQLSSSHILNNILTQVKSCSPTTQLQFYQSLKPSLFFVIAALSHCSELRHNMLEYLANTEHLMTEIECLKVWLTLMFSKEDSVRRKAPSRLAKWAANQGFMIKLDPSDLVVGDTFKTMITYNMVNGVTDTVVVEKLKLIAFNASLNEELRAAAFQQLAVLLSDGTTSKTFTSLHASIILILNDINIKSEMVIPMLRCLRHIIHHNDSIRQDLCVNPEVYDILLRLIGNQRDIDRGFKVDRETKAEVGTIIILLLTQDFSNPKFWSDSSYYTMYRAVLPECISISMYLPCHITTLPPVRPSPPPTLPSVWLPWLQLHFYIACSGSLDNFVASEVLEDIPSVQTCKECLRKTWKSSCIPNARISSLHILSSIGAITKDKDLDSALITEIRTRHLSNPHTEQQFYDVISRQNIKINPAFAGNLLCKIAETFDCENNTDVTHSILDMYTRNVHVQQQMSNNRLFQAITKLFTDLQETSPQNLSLLQVNSKALAIASFRRKLPEAERLALEEFIVKQIDTISFGRGSVSSFMGAEILRNLFCVLSNITTNASKLKVNWIVSWLTDKDPVIRSSAFSLAFAPPEYPLATETAAVLAISCFLDQSELYTVRQQALYFLLRILESTTSRSDKAGKESVDEDVKAQALALVMLVIKRMEFYKSCVSYVVELQHIMLYKADVLVQSNSQMISTYFEDTTEKDRAWNGGLRGLYYILDGILDVINHFSTSSNLTSGKEALHDLLSPLQKLFTVETLKSVIMFENNDSTLGVYVSCFVKTIRLILASSSSECYDKEFVATTIDVISLESELKSVELLKTTCQLFVKKILPRGILTSYWTRLLPSLSNYLKSDTLKLPSLDILYSLLTRESSGLLESLDKHKEISRNLGENLHNLSVRVKVLSTDNSDLLIFTVVGILSQLHHRSQKQFLHAGMVEHVYEMMCQIKKHIQAISLVTSDKENNRRIRNSGKPKGNQGKSEIKTLLKTFSTLLYCLSGSCVQNEEAAKRLLDLDIFNIISDTWGYYSTNIMVLNSTLKLISVLIQANPSTSKILVESKPLFSHILDSARKAILFSTHPLAPLTTVFFDCLSLMGKHEECIIAIWKAGFLSYFPKYEKQKTDPQKLGLWVTFVKHISYTNFGNNNILSIPHILDLLLEMPHSYRSDVLIVLRSLCFNSKLHPKLFGHENFMQYILDSVNIKKPKQAVLALQVILLLITFSSKAKSLFRAKGAGQCIGKLELDLQKTNEPKVLDMLERLLCVYD